MEVPALDGGDFHTLTITRQLGILDSLLAGSEADLIGSSLGGYVAALYGARNKNVRRLVLLAPAFDFHRLWQDELGPERTAAWRETGELTVFHYASGRDRTLAYGLMEDAERYEPFPDCRQPLLIFHGEQDQTAPVAVSERYVRDHSNAQLRILASGHELTDVVEDIWPEMLGFLTREYGT